MQHAAPIKYSFWLVCKTIFLILCKIIRFYWSYFTTVPFVPSEICVTLQDKILPQVYALSGLSMEVRVRVRVMVTVCFSPQDPSWLPLLISAISHNMMLTTALNPLNLHAPHQLTLSFFTAAVREDKGTSLHCWLLQSACIYRTSWQYSGGSTWLYHFTSWFLPGCLGRSEPMRSHFHLSFVHPVALLPCSWCLWYAILRTAY